VVRVTFIGAIALVVTFATDATAESYSDPFAYCRAVKTIDVPDSRYVGPKVTPKVAQALKLSPSEIGHGVIIEWRCANGALLACVQTNDPTICDTAPWLSGEGPNKPMIDQCSRNPNGFLASHGRWICKDGRPVVDPVWRKVKLDQHGYPVSDWTVIGP
jgi:hypothetical protein